MSGHGTPPPVRPQVMIPQPFPMPMAAPPTFFVNGFGTSYSASEFVSVFNLNERSTAVMFMAPIVAKAYARSLLEAVEEYERNTGTSIPSMNELVKKIETSRAAENQ